MVEPSEAQKELRSIDRRVRDQARRLRWSGLIAASYALDAVFLALFAALGTIAWRIPLLYAAGGAIACSLHHLAYARGWNLSQRDPNLTAPFVTIGAGLQLVVVAAAPQITFPWLANVFTVFAFGMTWLSVRESIVIWSGSVLALAGVLFLLESRIGIAAATPAELGLSWLYFSLVLVRLLALSVQANALRARLAESRRRLADSLAQIQELVHYDELTKALNRRSLMARLEQERGRALRTGAPFTVALLDLDHFKRVNDTYGHAAGDAVLKGFVDAVHRTMRETDVFGRFGGEEFLLILTAATSQAVGAPLERIRRAVEARVWSAITEDLKVTVSAGAAGFVPPEPVSELLRRADAALYAAKHAGRNCAVIA